MTEPGIDVSPAVARLVADAADAFQDRRARGEDPDPEEYASRHPDAADHIRRVLDVLRWAPAARPSGAGGPLQVLGDFRIVREVGRGGMGMVYEAEQISLGRRVALKVLPFAALADRRLLARFKNEARAAAVLDHPHVVKVFGVGQDRGVHFIAMQFIDGRPLSDLIRERRTGALASGPRPARAAGADATTVTNAAADSMADTASESRPSPTPFAGTAADCRQVAAWGIQAAEALEHAHSLGVVHRDVKPGNLLLDWRGQVWVADFGLAKLAAADAGLTGTGDVLGTLRYMSPEQALAKHDLVDHRADVYSLGATLYELLTLTPAVDGTEKAEILRRITDTDPVPPRRLNRGVPRDLETVVLRCLEKNPNDRYPTAKEVADDLRRFTGGEAVRARPVGALGRLARWRRRNRGLAAALAAAALALVGVTAVSARWAVRERQNADQLGRALYDAEYRLAENYLDQGVWRCETGDARAGLVWLARALEKAPPGSDRLQETIRLQLAGWSADVAPLIAAVDIPGPIKAAALSPDGKSVWVAGLDRVVRRWDVDTGEVLEGPRLSGDSRALLWSPNGRVVASVGNKVAVERWDATTGRRLDPPVGGSVTTAAWSADGSFLVTGDKSGEVRRWDGLTGAAAGWEAPARPDGPVRAVAVSPDGRRIATGDGTAVRFWDAATGRSAAAAIPCPATATGLAFSPGGETLLVLQANNQTQVWDLVRGEAIGKEVRHRGMVRAADFAATGRVYLTADRDRSVRFWQAATGEPVGAPITHSAAVMAAAFSRDRRRLLTAGADGALRVWGPGPSGPGGLVLPHGGNVTAAALSPDGARVLTAGFNRVAQVWDAATGKPLGPQLPHAGMVMRGRLSPDGRLGLTVEWDRRVWLWHLDTDEPRGRPLAHPAAVNPAEFAPDGRTVVTGDLDGRVRFWDVATAAERAVVKAHAGEVLAAAACPDRGWVATAGEDGRVWVWNPAAGTPVGPPLDLGAAVRSLAFDQSGARLAAGGGRLARVWDPAAGTPLGPPLEHTSEVWAVALAPDGGTLLAGTEDGAARLWDVNAGRPRGHPLRHQDSVRAVAWSPDGRTAVTGSWDGTARRWDGTTGKPVGPPMVHDGRVWMVAVQSDGRRLLTGGWDGTARLWSLPHPASGSTEEVTLWAEVATGLRLDGHDVIWTLDEDTWRARRDRLAEIRALPR